MKINDYVLREKNELMERYLSNAREMFRDYNIEREKTNDYNGRQLLELIQNADDETNDTNKKIYIELKNNILIVANNGNPFTEKGVYSLMRSHSSPKRHEKKIGRKGTGFRAILDWSKSVYIKSNELSIEFSAKNAENELKKLMEKNDDFAVEVNNYGGKTLPIAILTCPVEKKANEEYNDYTTYIVIEIEENKEIYKDIEKQIENLDGETLLFINNLETIHINVEGKHTVFKKKLLTDDGHTVEISYSDFSKEPETWYIATKQGKISKENCGDRIDNEYELKVAYTIPPKTRSNKLYSYFKTDLRFDFPAAIHGTFDLSGDRNNLDKSAANKEMLDCLAELLVETALKLRETSTADYNGLRFVMFQELDDRIKELGFEKKLIEQIKSSELFPNVDNQYKSFENGPLVYYDTPDVTLFKKLSNLLIYSNDCNISIFLKQKIGTQSYKYDSLVEWTNNNKCDCSLLEKAKIFKFYIDYFFDEIKDAGNIKPLLFVNSEGITIKPGEETFRPPMDEVVAPSFVSINILSTEQLELIKSLLGNRQYVLDDALRAYKFKLYASEDIIKKTTQAFCKLYERDRAYLKDYLQWLYKMYKVPAYISTKRIIYLPNRSSKLTESNQLFFGEEYGNEFGVSLISLINKSDNILVDLSGIDMGMSFKDDIVPFFEWLSIRKYPDIENEQDFGKIIETAEFEQIIAWYFKDEQFKNKIKNTTVLSILRSKEWVRTKYREKQIIEKSCLIGNIGNGFNDLLECVSVDYDSKYCNGEFDKIKSDYFLTEVGIINDFSNMKSQRMYEILTLLVSYGTEIAHTARDVYNKLASSVPKDLPRNTYYYSRNNFILNGKILAMKNGKEEFYPVTEVVAVGKKKLCMEITDQLAIMEIKHDKNKDNIKAIFGVEIVRSFNETCIKMELNHLSTELDKHIKDLLPYLYCYRIDEDSDRREFNQLNKLKVFLCSDIEAQYTYKGEKKPLHLKPYEYIYEKDENKAYIMLGDIAHETKKQLISDYQFSLTIMEIFEEVTGLQKLSECAAALFGLSDNNRNKMLQVNLGDIFEDDLKKSRELFNFDYKQEFIKAICTYKNMECIKLPTELEDCFDIGFDYEDINGNGKFNYLIINLFKKLEMDVCNFNNHSSFPINLVPYFKWILEKRLLSLECQYNYYLFEQLIHQPLEAKKNFGKKMNQFRTYGTIIDYKNSIYFDVNEQISTFFNINLEKVENLDGKQLSNIFKNRKAKLLVDLQINQDDACFDDEQLNSLIYFYDDDIVSQSIKNYINGRKDMLQDTADNENDTNFQGAETAIVVTIESVDIKRPDEQNPKTHCGGNSSGRSYNSNSNIQIGLKGEKYVYEELIKDQSIKEVKWVSGNAQKLGECFHGDDSLGYDIYYLLKDDPKEIHYVEVKATTGDTYTFHLSKNEKEFGERHKKYYEIMLVTNVNDCCPKINKLGHIFDYSLNEDFFTSSQFIVETDSFSITAQKV
ncbi:DUF3883 domain-containing protein [Lacrimispora amygdalina]|uniref:DUF3883 domain-containing protein n=1 Tax=Lacrimispora amygdalina TaxID=253257 RepID=UPI00140E3CB8|nr:DUF3883 domain-containing protein [Lacrimispora amygdalina]